MHQPEVGLLLGLILSDECEYQHYHYDHFHGARERFFNRDEDIIREFKEACSKLGLRVNESLDPPKLGQPCWRLETNSMLLYLLLKRYDDFIVKAPANIQAAFLRGLMLGDGCVKNLTFHNTDLKLIKTMCILLRVYGIKHSVNGPYLPIGRGRKPQYCIYIKSQSREKFLTLTGLAETLHAISTVLCLSIGV